MLNLPDQLHAIGMLDCANPPAAADVASRVGTIRGGWVLIDADLAELYGVSTRVFNQAVRGNLDGVPSDFLISLSNQLVAS